jgi:hypothetical protein
VIPHRANQQIEAALDSLDLPDPLTFDSLFEAVREQWERPLTLHRDPHPLSLNRPCGLWWRSPEGADHIWVAPETRGAQALHILGHEIGHMMLDHPPMELPSTIVPQASAPEPAPDSAPAPHSSTGAAPGEDPAAGPDAGRPFKYLPPEYLDAGPTLLGRARAQTAGQDPEYVRREDEAERFASLLRRRAAAAASRSRPTNPFLDRLRHSL